MFAVARKKTPVPPRPATPLRRPLQPASNGRVVGSAFDFSAVPLHSKQGDSSRAAAAIPRGCTTGLTAAAVEEDGMWPAVTGNGGGPAQPALLAASTGRTVVVPPTPPKLTKKTVGDPITSDCGKFNWRIQWELDKATTTGGLIVQKVELPHAVTKCDGTVVGSANAKGLNPGWYPIWEAWQVNKDQRVTTHAEAGFAYDDKYSSLGEEDAKGSLTVKGTAEFYDNLTLPPSFKVTGKPPADKLPSTTTAPTLKGGTGAISHNLKASWDCCATGEGASKTTTVTPT